MKTSPSPTPPSPSAGTLPARSGFSLRGLLHAGLVLATGLVATTAHAQSNYATPYFFTTLAGVNASGPLDGTLTTARFSSPRGVAVDASGNVYVGDTNNNTIRKITFFGVVTTLAGTAGSPGTTNGTGSAARFNVPAGVAVDLNGNVYVGDTANHAIRKITAGGAVTTLAGGTGGSADGTGTSARFLGPNGVAVDRDGNVYVADTGNHSIRKITPAGVVTTLAGGLSPGSSGSVDGTGGGAKFSAPFGVAVESSGANIYVADRDSYKVRKVTAAGVVTSMAGLTNFITGDADGNGTTARFASVVGVAVDGNGNVYVADSTNSSLRKVTQDGTVTTLAGLTRSTGSTDGTGSAVRFNSPQGIAVDSRGNLYVADTLNHTVRMSVFAPDITPQPISQVVAPGANATFTSGATSNVPITFQWRKDGVAIPGATTSTPVVSPNTLPISSSSVTVTNIQTANLGNYTLVATNMAGFSTSNVGILSFTPPPSFTTHPAGQSVAPGASATFSASATSSIALTYQWQKDGAAIPGATNATLTVNNVQVANLGSYTLVATNAVGPTTSNVAVLSFVPSPEFTTHPAGQNVAPGASVTFTASATSSIPITYQWQKDGVPISGATTTTLTVSNVQVANLGNYTLVAINSVGPTTSNVAVLGFIPSTAGRLINLSILTTIPASGDTFTMGYVIGGSGTTGTKPLVIRAAGPSLAALGVGGTLNDPKIELFAGSTKTGENDNWGGSAAISAAMAAVGAFPYTGPTSLDSAVAANLSPGDNSVKVSAAGTGTGTVIAEIYDATPAAVFVASTPRLVNVSVLKNLGTGLTVGFVIGGLEAKTVLIRAVGPTLGAVPFNIPGVVADPQLTLFNAASAKIGENDNWGGTAALTAAFTQVGAFALFSATSRDAALLATLQPGNYTVQVSGVGGTTGLAIVEVYEVP